MTKIAVSAWVLSLVALAAWIASLFVIMWVSPVRFPNDPQTLCWAVNLGAGNFQITNRLSPSFQGWVRLRDRPAWGELMWWPDKRKFMRFWQLEYAPLGSSNYNFMLNVPIWMPFVVGVSVGGYATLARRRALNRESIGMCETCGYDRRGLPAGSACPECASIPPKS